MSTSHRALARRAASVSLFALALLVGGCAAGAGSTSPPGSVAGSPIPSQTPAVEGISHPTRAADVVLRMEVGGGFMPMGLAMTQAPSFTLYGDGTIIVRDETQPFPQQSSDGTTALLPFHVGKLAEPDVQDLLRYALSDGGLGVARARYDQGGMADVPSTWFDVDAGGIQKRVEVSALAEADPSMPDQPDGPIRAAFARLAQRLRGLATTVAATAPVWQPERWRGTLTESGGFGAPPRTWPWKDLSATDFTASDPNGSSFLVHTLSAAQVAALGLSELGGGVQGIGLVGPSGTTYQLALRPIFPDETS